MSLKSLSTVGVLSVLKVFGVSKVVPTLQLLRDEYQRQHDLRERIDLLYRMHLGINGVLFYCFYQYVRGGSGFLGIFREKWWDSIGSSTTTIIAGTGTGTGAGAVTIAATADVIVAVLTDMVVTVVVEQFEHPIDGE